MLLNKLKPIKKPDIDNILKILLDALNGIAFEDDIQIVSVIAEKFFSDEDFIEFEILPIVSHETSQI